MKLLNLKKGWSEKRSMQLLKKCLRLLSVYVEIYDSFPEGNLIFLNMIVEIEQGLKYSFQNFV